MKKIVFLSFMSLLLTACGSNERAFVKSPVDELIQKLDKEPTFTIVLFDMDMEDNMMSDKFYHQYKIITEKDSQLQTRLTEKMQVSEEFFWKNENNMGMELASKTKDGKISKVASPAGFNNYVGNQQYGQWRTGSNGDSFWEFYGKYAMMSSIFGMMSSPIRRYDYDDYHRNYRGSQPYYGGTAGRPMYGTSSPHIQKSNPNFFERRASKSSWVSSSKSTLPTSSSTSSKSSSWFGSKSSSSSSSSKSVTRSSSRYSGSSSGSSRSRGGSSGK